MLFRSAFEIATKAAYRQSVPKAGVQLLEPIMKVDVFSPEDNVGDVIGDLNRRRGMIKSQQTNATSVRLRAECPLSDMFGYIGSYFVPVLTRSRSWIWSRRAWASTTRPILLSPARRRSGR